MNIFIRYAERTTWLPNNFMTKAYDCRFLYILSGKGTMTFSDRVEDLCENSLCYYVAGESYLPLSSKDEPLEFITINFDFIRDYENIKNVFSPVREVDFDDSMGIFPELDATEAMFQKNFILKNAYPFRKAFIEIATLFQSNYMHCEKTASAILQSICYKILDIQPFTHNELYLKILSYIDSHYSTIHSNADIAKKLSYHEYYINRIFKKYSNKTIHEYIIETRLNKAADFLINSNRPISQIADEVGFINTNHFSAKFKNHFGISPTQYRNSITNRDSMIDFV